MTQEIVQELFDYKDGKLVSRVKRSKICIGDVIGTPHCNGYLATCINYKKYLVHRLIYLWHHGALPPFLDHINGIRDDNRIENLRPATVSENMRNTTSRKNSTSKYLGVYWRKDRAKWCARIFANNKHINLGNFTEEADAAQAYNFAAWEHFGKFAKFNEVREV